MSDNRKSETERVEILKKGIKDGKPVFLLIYMNGCGPCNEIKPKWYDFEDKHENDNDVVVVDIEQGSIDDVADLIGESPGGFPCMRYIHNGKVEEYEECNKLDKSDLRSPESLEKWFKIKIGKQEGGKRKRKLTLKHGKKSRRGGKWSLKYKKSINCKHPKGFSQRQHCKYGRKNWKK
jgi:thiol-disulfide isomerase/thioredoxin